MKKRIIPSILAGALALSLAVPAFAAAGSTTVTGSYNDIKLAVTVSTSGKAYINPYGLPVALGETSIKNEKITTLAPLSIQNKSDVALKVKGNLIVDPTTGVNLVASTAVTTNTQKNINVNLEVFETNLTADDMGTDATVLNETFAKLGDKTPALTATATGAHSSTNAPVPGDGAGDDTTGTLILREGDEEGNVQKRGVALFRLSGDVNTGLATGTKWEKTDGFTAKIAWTFTPDEFAPSAGTLSVTPPGSTTGNGTATLTWDTNLADAKVYPKTVKWESEDTAVFTVADASANLGKATAEVKATITGKTNATKDLTVYVTATDGITYVATASVAVP